MSKLPAQMGHVFLRGRGSFTGEIETVSDHGQLPQFMPRTQWPTDELAAQLQRHTSALGTNIDWREPDQIQGLKDRTLAVYGALEPMPPFQNRDRVFDSGPWLAHVAFMHDILHRTMNSDTSLALFEMFTLVRAVSYGMFESMAFLYPWRIEGPAGTNAAAAAAGRLGGDLRREYNMRARFNDDGTSSTFRDEWMPEFSMRMKAGEFREPERNSRFFQERIYGRRWVVAPVLCGNEHWSMTIFDRCRRHVYILDCGDGATRGERIEACVQLWARFWNWLRVPWDFAYFVPSATKQTSAKDSGYVCVVWLMCVLRNQVGKTMSLDDKDEVRRVDMPVADPSPNTVGEPGDLCVGDWLPDGCRLPSSGLLAVRRIVKALICNELGLKKHDVLTKAFRSHSRPSTALPSALALLQETCAELAAHNGTLPADMFWTAQGGPQFAMPQRIGVGPYDDSAPRRHRRPAGAGRVRLETRGPGPGPGQRVEWPASVPYTADNPVNRPAYGVHLVVADIDAQDHLDSDTRRHFAVTLVNREAPPSYRRLQRRQRIELDKIHARVQGNGTRVLRLTLQVGFGDDASREGILVDIPIPEPLVH